LSAVVVMLQQNIFRLGLVSVLWVLAGFSLAFGPDAGGAVIGNLAALCLKAILPLEAGRPGRPGPAVGGGPGTTADLPGG
jgi:ammonia channel protein AmtB